MTGEKRKKALKKALNFILMTVGSVVYAAGISLFLDPNALAPGGVAGISIILHQVTNVDTGVWILLLNIPIVALGIWKFGFQFILSTIYCTALSSFVTNVLTSMGAVTDDLFLAALAGSSLMALGMGLVFKAGATTGGMDIVVKVLRIRMPHMRTGSLVLILDALVVIVSAFVFRDMDKAMYAGVAVFITSVVLDLVLYGRDGAKLVYIISDNDEVIANRLLAELNLGVTYMNGSGAYSGREKKVIMCVMHKNLSPKAEEIVKEEDPLAFMIITNATEIYGEGYKSIFSEKL